MDTLLFSTLFDTTATLCAAVLAAVLGVAAAVKLTSISTTTEEFAALGLGRSRIVPVAVAAVEAAAGVALIVRPPLGALVAAILLVAFTGVVTWGAGRRQAGQLWLFRAAQQRTGLVDHGASQRRSAGPGGDGGKPTRT